MLVGILVLAWGYLGEVKAFFYAGLGIVLLGVIPGLAFAVLGKPVDPPPSRHGTSN
jgi:hypothetical protein